MGAAASQNYPNTPFRPRSVERIKPLKRTTIQHKRHKLIEEEINNQKQLMTSSKTRKILLLGPGECGKSTLLKQMRIIHAEGFTLKEADFQKIPIRANLVQSIANIIKAMEKLGLNMHGLSEDDIETVCECAEAAVKINEVNLTPEVVQAIKHLWAHPNVQVAYKRRSEYQLIDSAQYFLDSVDRISSEHYVPTQDDILRCRVKTTGVVEMRFETKGFLFRVVDVGGQRSERRKWIQCFDDMNSILFVASLSEYDQTLEEDNATNRMKESLQLFGWLCEHKLFLKTPIILFLNKIDLFEEKIRRVPISVTFPEYDGPQSSQESLAYINDCYHGMDTNLTRSIFTHTTCATDTKQIAFILDATFETMIDENLTKNGMY